MNSSVDFWTVIGQQRENVRTQEPSYVIAIRDIRHKDSNQGPSDYKLVQGTASPTTCQQSWKRSRTYSEMVLPMIESRCKNLIINMVEARGVEPLIRQQKTTNVRRGPFYQHLATMDIDGLSRIL